MLCYCEIHIENIQSLCSHVLFYICVCLACFITINHAYCVSLSILVLMKDLLSL